MSATAQELLDLAARVEAATGADRELDLDIAVVLRAPTWKDAYRIAALEYGLAYPAYTGSIEAAVSIVPEGWWWSVGNCSVSADASVGPDVAHCDKETLIRFDAGIDCDLPHPSTPARALTAAALRGLAQEPRND